VSAVSLEELLLSRKLLFSQVFIDANRINALQRDSHMNQLEKWAKNGVIQIRMPDTALEEVEAAGDKQRAKTFGILAPCKLITTDEERAMLTRIETIIAQGKQELSESDKKDAQIVFTAWKYSSLLVTADRWLLQKAKAIPRCDWRTDYKRHRGGDADPWENQESRLPGSRSRSP
jgi:hypothetical protein